jgi:phosphoglycolate phosphatase-like HAD superfamily hydrolase
VTGGFFGEEADIVYAAVALSVVHAVTDDELIGDFEGYIVGFDGNEAALRLVEAGGDLERGGLVLEHQAAEVAKGEAGVEDVFDDDDVLAFDGVVDVLDELDGAGGDAGAAVAGDGDEVEGVIDADGSGEVGEEDGCAFEYSDEDDRLALVVGGDLGTDGAGALGDLLLGEEDGHGFGGRERGGAIGHRG